VASGSEAYPGSLDRLLRLPILMAAFALYPLLLFAAALMSERESRPSSLGSARLEALVKEEHLPDDDVAPVSSDREEEDWDA